MRTFFSDYRMPKCNSTLQSLHLLLYVAIQFHLIDLFSLLYKKWLQRENRLYNVDLVSGWKSMRILYYFNGHRCGVQRIEPIFQFRFFNKEYEF